MSHQDKSNVEKPSAKKIGITLRQAPYGNSLTHEALDIILAASVYEQEISVFFIGDGVFQLIKAQESHRIEQKSIEKKLAAFEMYDINNIFVCNNSLKERRLNIEDLSISTAQIVEHETLTGLLHSQNTLLSF
ncbi:MAG: sulfurtransferase complex subunit TusC [Cellvibrionaceae bacterium]